jgi:hypothetical protein
MNHLEFHAVCHKPHYLRLMSLWMRQNIRNLLVYKTHREYNSKGYHPAVIDCFGTLVAIPAKHFQG